MSHLHPTLSSSPSHIHVYPLHIPRKYIHTPGLCSRRSLYFAPGVERKSHHCLYVEGGQDAEHPKFLVQNQMKRYCHHIGKQMS